MAEQVVNDSKSDDAKSGSQGDLDTQAKWQIGIVPMSVAVQQRRGCGGGRLRNRGGYTGERRP